MRPGHRGPLALTPAPGPVATELDHLIARARAHGHPVRVPPIATAGRGRSRNHIGPWSEDEPRRIVLTSSTLVLPAAERRWVLAHELSHQLRDDQRGGRYPEPRWAWPLTVALLVLLIGSILGCGAIALGLLHPYKEVSAAVAVAAAVLMAAFLAVLTRWERAEETAVDHTAAEVFGAVLTPAGVRRLQRREGRLFGRLLPVPVRSHPRPAARRVAGLAVLAEQHGQTLPPDLTAR